MKSKTKTPEIQEQNNFFLLPAIFAIRIHNFDEIKFDFYASLGEGTERLS
jgi:hypothetical protein